MSIVIFGAGIAGLTCALELIEKGFKVIIFEKDNIAGGMAKSKRIKGVPTEHSWRGYGNFYLNTFNLLKRIPIQQENFTSLEISKHNKVNDAWITYRNNVYDVTDFIAKHPGGAVIKKALGKDVEKVWENNGVSWHTQNKNVLKMLEKYKIGSLRENFSSSYTAYDNLYSNLTMKGFYNKVNEHNQTNLEFYFDILKLSYNYFIFSLGNKRSNQYYKTRFIDYVKNIVSKPTYDYLVYKILGPGLGLDYNSASYGSYFHVTHLYLGNNIPINQGWNVMKKPTSEAFINPLVSLLINKGCEIVYNSELYKLYYDNQTKKITSCDININNQIKNFTFDDYIVAINPNNCYDIFNRSKMDKIANQHLDLQITNNQISFRLGFTKKVNFSVDNIGIVIMESPYNITMYPQENFFNVPIDYNYKLKSLWSGTCVQVYNNGKLYGKHATQLTKEELINEIIQQILICQELQNDIYQNSGFKITKEDIIYSEIYDEWVWDNQNKTLESKNKKWVNNIYNEEFKPSQNTEYTNLYLSGAHTNTSIKVWSMEAACESGKIVANMILKKNNKHLANIHIHTKPIYFKIFESVDDLLYDNGFPSIFIFIIWLLLFIIYKLFTLITLKN